MRDKVRFDIQLLLPDLPDEHDACADRLSELILANEGIEKAHVDSGEFCIHFDPNRISFDKVRTLVFTAGAELGSRYGHLLLKTSPTYARHARTIRGRLAAINGVVDVGVAVDGIIRIEFDKQAANEQVVLSAISGLGISFERLPSMPAVSAVEGDKESQRGREVWSMKTQYLSEEVMIPGSSLLLSFDAVIGRMVLEQADGDSPEP